MTRSRLLIAVAALASLAGGIGTANASDFSRHHPRQAQVQHREHVQLERIRHERAEGRISHAQARALAHETRAIGRESRADARAHGGLTRHDHRVLNHQLNAQSRAIGR